MKGCLNLMILKLHGSAVIEFKRKQAQTDVGRRKKSDPVEQVLKWVLMGKICDTQYLTLIGSKV